MGDGLLDSTVLIDGFAFSTEAVDTTVTTSSDM
jgi:hypothetical protein